MREALQAIDQVVSPDFFLHLHTRGTAARPIALKALRRRVQDFVDSFDHQTVVAAIEAGQPPPTVQHDECGAHFLIELVPKNFWGRAGDRAIGSRMLAGGQLNPHLAIKSAVEGKAGRYGKLHLPYVIAVNALDQFARADSAVDALFGTKRVVIAQNGEQCLGRNPNGALQGSDGPVYRRVSGVLSTERLSPWDLGQRSMRLILNPWAVRPLPDIPLGVEVQRVVDDRLVVTPGKSIREILGLPAGWPE